MGRGGGRRTSPIPIWRGRSTSPTLSSVRVYVAVNTLIPEAELEAVAALLTLYEAGADAVLVQDLGVSIARELVPDLELHASTQMTISSIEGARWAADAGLKRAVLARELSLAEVEEIARASPPLKSRYSSTAPSATPTPASASLLGDRRKKRKPRLLRRPALPKALSSPEEPEAGPLREAPPAGGDPPGR